MAADKTFRKKMKKLIVAMTCMVSVTAFAQTQDSLQKLQLQYNKFVDSVGSHTTLKEFNTFLDETITQKFFREGTFTELYQYFINTKWANRNVKPPKK